MVRVSCSEHAGFGLSYFLAHARKHAPTSSQSASICVLPTDTPCAASSVNAMRPPICVRVEAGGSGWMIQEGPSCTIPHSTLTAWVNVQRN